MLASLSGARMHLQEPPTRNVATAPANGQVHLVPLSRVRAGGRVPRTGAAFPWGPRQSGPDRDEQDSQGATPALAVVGSTTWRLRT